MVGRARIPKRKNAYPPPTLNPLLAAGIFLKKLAKKGFFRHFLENVDQKLRFFGARSSLRLVYKALLEKL